MRPAGKTIKLIKEKDDMRHSIKAILAAVTITAGASFAAAAADLPPGPPVGYQAIAVIDPVWIWTGKVQTAMSSSTHPTNGNMDMSQFHGRYRGEKILAEIEGPGCIYRIWSAAPSGTIKVYLDNDKKPEIKCAFKSYLEGRCEGLPSEFTVGRSANYMPIPFEKSIVITAPGFHLPGYYQVSYQTYDPSVAVESFDREKVLEAPFLEGAKNTWATDAAPPCGCGQSREKEIIDLGEGKTKTAIRLAGPGVILRLAMADPDDPSDPLQDLVMRIYWDGEKSPAVEAPVDAFFINRFDLKDHWPGGDLKSMFVNASSTGYQATFPMPFAGSARIELENRGPARKVMVAAAWEKLDSLPEGAMRFHAAFREQDYDTDASKSSVITMQTPIDPATNYVVLERSGKGHYLGCAIFVESVGTIWWGEGDENTWIDGASKPQIQGTGTEDEFNWSWGFMPHMSPVSGTLPVVPECKKQECDNITGENIAYRFRPSDYVPFSESIKVSYEVLGISWLSPNAFLTGNLSQKRGDDYASIAYWYQLP